MINILCVLIIAACAQDVSLEPVPELLSNMATRFFIDFTIVDPQMQNYRPLLANVIRLAFHSCAGSTGCCGYVNLDEPSNGGLSISVEYLDSYLDDWTNAGFSRADLYAYASQVATGIALGDDMATILQTVELGRTDCETIPEVGEVGFPSAHESPFEYMATHFGFSNRETVAIMGAHNCGRATSDASGFEGFWVPNSLTLNNEFYDRISDDPWEQKLANVINGVELHAWEQNHEGLNLVALNSDMFLVRNFDISESGQVINNDCRTDFNNCQNAATLADVIDFSNNNAQFQSEFRQVYARMLRSAGDGLEQELTLLCDRFDCSGEVQEDEEGEAERDESSEYSYDGPGNGGGHGGRGRGRGRRGGRGGRGHGRGRRLL